LLRGQKGFFYMSSQQHKGTWRYSKDRP
jgi:hypothetical protein